VSSQAEEPCGIPPEHHVLVRTLLDWFSRNARALPWRREYSPYQVWVSEIMLQQTQAERAATYFERWMRRFHDIRSVAEADFEELLKFWEGLGYYRRVRNLHKAAREIMLRHGGELPLDHALLRSLPGIGEYTAGAILSIAGNEPVPAVDANVERVFARLFDIDAPVKTPIAANYVHHMAAALIPPGEARAFNQAIMELGALICGRTPRCGICPLGKYCRAKHLGIAAERPVPGKKYGYTALDIISGVLMHEGLIFIQKRLDSGVWAGLWEFPGGRLEPGEKPSAGIVREFFEETEFSVLVTSYLGVVRHSYTRYRINMHCFVCAFASAPAKREEVPAPVLHAATDYRWEHPAELEKYTFPAGHRKLLDAWLPALLEAATQDGGAATKPPE
jgi:A/G-specific adenine glycosylase